MFLWSLLWTLIWMGLAMATVIILFKTLRTFLTELWRILVSLSLFFGTSASGQSKPVHLYPFLCKVDSLDEVSMNELYSFLKDFVQVNEPLTLSQVHSMISGYSHIAFFREKTDGSLRGVSVYGVERKCHNDYKYTYVKIGLTYFKSFYRGGPLAYLIPAYFLLKELILHPFTPLYFGGKSYSYKSYLIAVRLFSQFYPRYDQETPELEESLIHDLASTILLPEEEYDKENFVIKRELSNLKDHETIVDEDAIKDPHIKFFVDRNPGWKKGHCLMVLTKFHWRDLFSATRDALKRRKPNHKQIQDKVKPRPLLARRFTFQEDRANRYAHMYYDMDIMNVPCSTPKMNFEFSF